MTHVLTIGMGWFAEEPGGLNSMYAGLLGGLRAGGAAVHGLVAGDRRCAGTLAAGVAFFAPREAYLLARLHGCRRAARALLRGEPGCVVAAHFALYALPVLDLIGKRRFVVHFHGPWASESQSEGAGALSVAVKQRIEARVYRRADRLITLSAAFAAVLEQRYGVARERIDVVPGGVDADRYALAASRLEARERLRLPADRPLILSVRRLVRRMGLERLVEAMVEVRRSAPDALLLIAGSGALSAELARRIAALDLQQHVRLLGFVPEEQLPWLYRACDLSVVPSVALEGFGLTTIESLAAGTPVLVTPIGGLPETVAALDPALVLPDASAAALADALRCALRNTGQLPSAARCAGYAREHFHWPVIARQVQAIYER